ncbi:UNVERIFIED_ORG: hypothetical protein ABID57_000716 [Arthrobacter sp. UYEF1]
MKEVADLRREIEAMKAKQLLGGDNVVVTATNVASANIGPLAAADTVWVTITTTPSNQSLTIWDFHYSVYVDGGGPYLITNLLPAGSALSAALVKLIRVQYIPDWASSVDTTGVRKYYVGITNTDSSSHTISFQAVNYAIKTPTS